MGCTHGALTTAMDGDLTVHVDQGNSDLSLVDTADWEHSENTKCSKLKTHTSMLNEKELQDIWFSVS
jgi:hypothetical protein